MSRSNFVDRGGLWVLSQSVLMLGVVVGAVLFKGNVSKPGLAVGVALCASGAFFGIAGVAVLKGSRTAFPKPRDGSRLIRDGIYSRVRHPLYTSVLLLSVGWALCWGSWPAFSLAVLMVPFFHCKANVEERWLRQKFPEYDAYSRRVPRFIPWVY
jgi:protein-S-isoprenylcysteine O-methyltransferase Ste14